MLSNVLISKGNVSLTRDTPWVVITVSVMCCCALRCWCWAYGTLFDFHRSVCWLYE